MARKSAADSGVKSKPGDGSDEIIKITALGMHLAKLPCDVHMGKLLIYSAMLSCAEEGCALA